MEAPKSSLLSPEFWVAGGGAVMIYDAPTGLHALAMAAVIVALVSWRSWLKKGTS